MRGIDSEVVDQLHMVLIDEYYKGNTVVLLIDDAQNMPVVTLENLRMLSNLETSQDKLIQIVLLGQPELDSLLDRYELRQIRQRIALRATIRPLTQKESFQYIRHRLDKAGGVGKTIFTNGALKRIVREAKGIPRRVNILCDNALVTALGYQKNPVTVRIAKEVIDDLAGKSSHALWKLIPLAAGALILVFALVALMPFVDSQFSDSPSLQKIEHLFERGVDQGRDLLVVSQNVNASIKKDVLSSESMTSASEDEEPLIGAPVEVFPVQHNSEPFKQPTERVGRNLEELQPLEIVPLGISSEDTEISINSEVLNQSTEAKVQDGGEKFEEISNLENGPEVKLVNNVAVAPSSVAVNQSTETIVRNVGEKLEELSNLETGPGGKLVNNVAVAPSAVVFNQSMETKVNNVGEKLEELSNQEIIPQAKLATDETPSQNSSNKKQHETVSVLSITKTMKKGDTLAGLMNEVYGTTNPTLLRLVLSHNRHIVNVRKIYPGQQILFPPLTKVEDRKKLEADGRVLVPHTREAVKASKEIYTESSHGRKPKLKKEKDRRPKAYAVAIVQEGDTLEKLAEMVYGSSDPFYVQRVLDFNPKIIHPEKILPGQDIVFPRVEEAKDMKNDSSQAHSRE